MLLLHNLSLLADFDDCNYRYSLLVLFVHRDHIDLDVHVRHIPRQYLAHFVAVFLVYLAVL